MTQARAKNSKMKTKIKKIVCQVLTDDVGKGTGPFVMALLIGALPSLV
jgi:hypothetical protein